MPEQVPNPNPQETWQRSVPKPRLADLTGHPRHNITPEPEGPVEVTAVQNDLVLYRKKSAAQGPATHMMPLDDFRQHYRPVDANTSAAKSSD